MHLLALAFPKTIPLAPLFGKAQTAVARTLGSGVPSRRDRIGGVARQVVAHGEVEVEYVNGRARSLKRSFDSVPDPGWSDALRASGYAPEGVRATAVSPQRWALRAGSLAKDYRGLYARRAGGPSTLTVEAPLLLAVTPPPAERKAILDALRPTVERAFHGQKVRFMVHMVASANDWAFLTLSPIAADGKALDLKDSDFAEAAAAGAEVETAYALLQRARGAWRPVETALLPTDVAWETWSDKRHAPAILFPDFAP